MRTTADYVALITSYHSTRPNYVATVSFSVDPFSDLQAFLSTFPEQFDIDVAIGAQLDIVGQWVGQSRNIPIPVANVFFSLDAQLLGFDRGIWEGPFDTPLGISQLDDDTYRRLLQAKVLANSWDGTVASGQSILDVFFDDPTTFVFLQDNGGSALQSLFFTLDDLKRGFDVGTWMQPGDLISSLSEVDMSMTIGVAGKIPSIVLLSVLGQGLIPIKPEGVALDYKVTSSDGAPLFGMDVQNQYISGFDSGAWGVDPDTIASLSL